MNPKFNYRIHKTSPAFLILSKIDRVHAPSSHFSKIYFNIILSSTPKSSKCSPFLRFPDQNPVCTSFRPLHATCPPYLSRLDLITRMILREKYRAQSSSLCSLLHSSVTSSLLGPNILLNALFSKTLSLHSCRHSTTNKYI